MFTNIERRIVDVGFQKFISSVQVLTFEGKMSIFLFQTRIWKLISNAKGALMYMSVLYGISVSTRRRPIRQALVQLYDDDAGSVGIVHILSGERHLHCYSCLTRVSAHVLNT